jgi:hypothetical protein
MPVDPVSALIKPGLDLLKTGLSAIRKRLGKRKADQMASAIIAELLKQSPDITAAEAQLAAIEATGAWPTLDIHRAKKMYTAARSYKAPAGKARWAARRGDAKKSASKREAIEDASTPRATTCEAKGLSVRWSQRRPT